MDQVTYFVYVANQLENFVKLFEADGPGALLCIYVACQLGNFVKLIDQMCYHVCVCVCACMCILPVRTL